MKLPTHKTKIVCTIGPASESPEVLRQMIEAGMNVARINFSHGDFESHRRVIATVRSAAQEVGRRVAILGDLPGPKIRVGQFAVEPIELRPGDMFTLTGDEVLGDAGRVSVSLTTLPQVLNPGDTIFLNDGIIQLEVRKIEGNDIRCRVAVGGELRSRKGINVPGIDLGVSAFTMHDRSCLEFAVAEGVDAVSQSFVQSADDVIAVREAARKLGHNPFIVAKIERSHALDHMDEILDAADGIMIARGDLGVEIPIEGIAIVQKRLIAEANRVGKPTITATQMLESMTVHSRPTRAEATDVANAILDGTDCVMLSGESAMGVSPVAAVSMLAKIAAETEPYRMAGMVQEAIKTALDQGPLRIRDLIAVSVESAVKHAAPAAVFVPTRTGATARSISRFRLPVWIVGVSRHESTCQRLQLTYGVYPVHEPDHPEDWKSYVSEWLAAREVSGRLVILTEGPSSKHPETNNRMEIIDLRRSEEH